MFDGNLTVVPIWTDWSCISSKSYDFADREPEATRSRSQVDDQEAEQEQHHQPNQSEETSLTEESDSDVFGLFSQNQSSYVQPETNQNINLLDWHRWVYSMSVWFSG